MSLFPLNVNLISPMEWVSLQSTIVNYVKITFRLEIDIGKMVQSIRALI